MLQMTRNTLFEKMDFGKCYGGDIVQKKLFRPNVNLGVDHEKCKIAFWKAVLTNLNLVT